ncbi:juvenile hormone esterase-like isoform X2 [Aphidius gifuensis]|uniref:juvenile hormone esterase-like isoform X2 n=1 Tax=Aphidius gifuensis TaxID=684658 RepID=UPI001CDB7A3D|nr:juvenile hormone esterase-like isoform X2 [Aphidius gifuensis]
MSKSLYNNCCNLFTTTIFFIIFKCIIQINGELSSIVYTNQGPVQGEILQTIVNSVSYSSFKGIPYGKPPIGELRFKPPEKAESWNETLISTSEGNQCPQMDFIFKNYSGNEDCLNLNVYTPKTIFEDGNNSSDKLLPVMVWIFGGQFKFGYVNSSFYGPDFFIEDNVVLVAMNYRLGALGLLALNITGATGNAALKDQTLALKWVKDNIIKFGGDPNSVTLFGTSTGASCVDLHSFSKLSQGLFHKSISMSGTPLNPWGFSTPDEAEARAFKLGELLGINTTSKEILLKELSEKSAKEIVLATENIVKADRPFKSTIESYEIAGETAFLSECIVNQLEKGNFSQIPHIAGFVANEILSFATSVQSLIDQSQFALKSMNKVLHNKVGEKIESFMEYLSSKSKYNLTDLPVSIVMEGINNLSDVLTILGIDTKQKLMLPFSKSPIYYYQNSFDAGVAHGDDLIYLFYPKIYKVPLDPTNKFSIVRKQMVRMFTNFAKYSNPTPNETDNLLNITWPVSGVEGVHLKIGNELKVINSRPINDNIKILEKYQNNCTLKIMNGCE